VVDQGAPEYPCDQWAGHFYQAMSAERFVTLGIGAARLALRVNSALRRAGELGLESMIFPKTGDHATMIASPQPGTPHSQRRTTDHT
jgi:hypothetical protein